jgi:hypothetical protein
MLAGAVFIGCKSRHIVPLRGEDVVGVVNRAAAVRYRWAGLRMMNNQMIQFRG